MPKYTPSDHDLLIEVKTVLHTVQTDIKDLKDGINAKLADHEARLKVVERNIIEISPDRRVQEHDKLMRWKERVEGSWKAAVTGLTILAGVLAFILRLAIDKWF